jgi:hypothetical protein
MKTGTPSRRRGAVRPLSLALFLVCGGLLAAGQASASGGPVDGADVTVCLAVPALSDARAIVVVPSGTVFAAQGKARGKKVNGAAMATGQALVTTETVTLTATQPCVGADAAGVVSVTRGWHGPAALSGGQGQVYRPVGRVSGNGLDSRWLDADETLRALVQAGGLSATAHGRLSQDVRLLESAADQEDADREQQARAVASPSTRAEENRQSGAGQQGAVARSGADALPDMSEGAVATDDLPSQRHTH